MKNKQQLAEEKQISVDTVTKTFRAAGIDTSKSEYDQDECDRFMEARRLMEEEHYTYKQVSERYGVGTTDNDTLSASSSSSANPNATRQAKRSKLSELDDLFTNQTHQQCSRRIGDALEDIPPIELMIEHELQERPQIIENIKAQFQLLSERLKAESEARRAQRQVYQQQYTTFNVLPNAAPDDEDEDEDDGDGDEDVWH